MVENEVNLNEIRELAGKILDNYEQVDKADIKSLAELIIREFGSLNDLE